LIREIERTPARARGFCFSNHREHFLRCPLAGFHCAFHAAVGQRGVLAAEMDAAMGLADVVDELPDLTRLPDRPVAGRERIVVPGLEARDLELALGGGA